MNNYNNKKCVVLELTDISEAAPSKLVNGNAHNSLGSLDFRHSQSSVVKQIPEERQRNKRAKKRMATIGAVLLTLGLLAGLIVPFALQLRSSSLLEARLSFIRRVLQDTPLIDGHWVPSENLSTEINFVHENLIAAHFWPVLVPCGAQFLDAVQLTLEKIDEIQRTVKVNEKFFELVDSSEGLEQVHLKGRVGILLGVEGGHTLGDSLGVLRSLYLLGARYLTITHNCNTVWAESSEQPDILLEEDFHSHGLAQFGKIIIKEMNRLGMIIDLSHVSEKTMHDVLMTSKAPVIFSHAGALSLCNDSLNIPDHILTKLALNGGIVMVNSRGCSENSIPQTIAHINYIRQKTGINHIGLGGDSDSEYPLLLAELARDRHWGTAAIRKLVGENLIRVFREVENVRDSLKNVQGPSEELIPAVALDGKAYCRYPVDN